MVYYMTQLRMALCNNNVLMTVIIITVDLCCENGMTESICEIRIVESERELNKTFSSKREINIQCLEQEFKQK